MTQHQRRTIKPSDPTATPHGSSQPPSEHPLFEDMAPFEATMLRVAMQDLDEDGLGSRPFIAATAELAPDVRRDLLLRASSALLGHCDCDGAAACLKFALGLEHVEPSDVLDRAIEHVLQLIARGASDDQEVDEDDEDDWSAEDVARLIEEVHRTPRSSKTNPLDPEQLRPSSPHGRKSRRP